MPVILDLALPRRQTCLWISVLASVQCCCFIGPHSIGFARTWFSGESTAIMMARPALLARALGTRIDDYRLNGYGRFYAARGSVTVPLSLRSEVAAFGRISSLGELHAEGIPAEGIPVVGLGPGGFLDAYDARPLRNRGDARPR